MSTETPFDLVRMDVRGHPVLVVYGELDALSSPRIYEALNALVAEEPTTLLIDLANVTFIDSSGLGALIVAERHLDEAGGQLRLVSVPQTVAKVFAIAGLDQRFHVYPTAEHATEDSAE